MEKKQESGQAVKYYRLSDVEKQKSFRNTWIIIDHNVYDVTRFLEEHPGGEAVLREHAGADATESYEEAGHSLDAKNITASFHIGELHPDDRQKTIKGPQSLGPTSEESTSWMTDLAIPGIVVATVMMMYHTYTSEG